MRKFKENKMQGTVCDETFLLFSNVLNKSAMRSTRRVLHVYGKDAERNVNNGTSLLRLPSTSRSKLKYILTHRVTYQPTQSFFDVCRLLVLGVTCNYSQDKKTTPKLKVFLNCDNKSKIVRLVLKADLKIVLPITDE